MTVILQIDTQHFLICKSLLSTPISKFQALLCSTLHQNNLWAIFFAVHVLQTEPGAAMSIQIPPGLTELLRSFTMAILRQRPADLVDFAVQYFTRLQNTRSQEEASVSDKTRTGMMLDREPMQTGSHREVDKDDEPGFGSKLILKSNSKQQKNKW